MRTFALAALAGCAAAAGGGNWGYFNYGKDWLGQCRTGQEQSPIDLSQFDERVVTGSRHSLKVSNFGDLTGARTHIDGRKAGNYANGALYLKRQGHPEMEIGRRMEEEKKKASSGATFGKVSGQVQLDENGSVQLQREEGNYVTLNYQPNQLHVHAPSEHTIDDQYYDLEMHFVMLPYDQTAKNYANFAKGQKAKDGEFNYKVNYGVLGVMFTETDCKNDAGKKIADCEAKLAITNDFFGAMNLAEIPTGAASPAESANAWWGKTKSSVPLKSFMEGLDTREFFAYNGSLTTPPCWEGVRWTVLKNAMPISANVMTLIKRNFGGNVNFAGYRGNNRVIQPRKNRDLFYNGASSLAVSMVAATAALLAF